MSAEGFTEHATGLLPAYSNGTLGGGDAGLVRTHLDACADCRADLDEWQAVGAAAHLLTAATPAPSRGLLDRAWLKIEQSDAANQVRPTWRRRWSAAFAPLLRRPARGAVAAVALAGVLLLGLAGVYASGVLTVFQPKQFVAVPVTLSELQTLPNFSTYGTLTFGASAPSRQVTSAGQASALSGQTVLVPGVLPAGVPANASYAVVPGQSATFTFSAAKARAAAAALGKTLPPMPANIDGSSLEVTTGTAVIAVYGGNATTTQALTGVTSANAAGKAATAVRAQQQQSSSAGLGLLNGLPSLVVAQTTVPTATANGATPQEIEQYLLNQPGISPQLKAEIQAIGDPSTTWPLPIPVGLAGSHAVTVQGVSGLAIADSTGIAGGLLWQKSGVIYTVVGTLSEQELLRVANSLH